MSFSIRYQSSMKLSTRHFTNNKEELGRSLHKMSSGRRFADHADELSSQSIARNRERKEGSYRKAMSNIEQGLMMLQTAEGGMAEIHNILVRLREKAVQAASGTLTDVERG